MSIYRLSAFSDEAAAPLSEQIAACQRAGICQIEMRGVGGKSVIDLTDAQAREAHGQLQAGGVSVWAMGSPFGKISILDGFAPHRDKFRRALELCRLLDTRRMRIFSFYMPEGQDPGAYRSEVLDRLSALMEDAEAAGVQLAHENEKGIYGDTDGRCLDLLTHFGGRLGGIFDPANFIQCGVRPEQAAAALAPYTQWLHAKDARLSDGSVVPAGKGDGHWPLLLKTFADCAGEVTLTLEPHLTVFEGLGALQHEALKQVYAYPDNQTAFAAAADALKQQLQGAGYHEEVRGTWTR